MASLYEKYRPSTWSEVLGQGKAVRSIRANLYGANLYGAYRPEEPPSGYTVTKNGYLIKA